MAYWLHSFNGLALPSAVGEGGQTLSVAEAQSSLLTLPGGVLYDPLGSDDAPVVPRSIVANAEILGDSALEVRATYDSWQAKVRKVGMLYRTPDAAPTGVRHWLWARLLRAESQREIGQWLWLPVTFEWQVKSWPWQGASGKSTTALDASPKSIIVTNLGNVRVVNPIITITPAGSAITALTVAIAGVSSWTYSGSIAATEALVVDCGRMSVKNDGVDDYAHLTFGGGHVIDEWMRLEPGSNTVVVTRTGGNNSSTCEIDFSAGWA